ncbi:MAG: ferrochelatase [Lachnospiraceae bacterium]
MIGVILYAYGAPQSLDDVEPYFSHMLNGKTPPLPMLASLHKQFRKLGSCDPLASVTERMAAGLEEVLSGILSEEIRVYRAYKHTAPFVEETIKKMEKDCVTRIVTLTVNPVYSKSGTGAFEEEVKEAAAKLEKPVEVIHVNHWHTHPSIVSVFAKRVKAAYIWLPEAVRKDAVVLFTVHSQRVDPELNKIYVKQFAELAEAIAYETGIPQWRAVYRSAAPHGEWLGPDVKAAIKELVQEGRKGFVTCELLSLSADIESYFEVGAECQEVCEVLGVEFAQAEFPNDSYDTITALAKLVKEQIEAVPAAR